MILLFRSHFRWKHHPLTDQKLGSSWQLELFGLGNPNYFKTNTGLVITAPLIDSIPPTTVDKLKKYEQTPSTNVSMFNQIPAGISLSYLFSHKYTLMLDESLSCLWAAEAFNAKVSWPQERACSQKSQKHTPQKHHSRIHWQLV